MQIAITAIMILAKAYVICLVIAFIVYTVSKHVINRWWSIKRWI